MDFDFEAGKVPVLQPDVGARTRCRRSNKMPVLEQDAGACLTL
jgi:hypothetical protein